MIRSIAPYLVGCFGCAIAWFAPTPFGFHPIVSAIVGAVIGVVVVVVLLRIGRIGLSSADSEAISHGLPRAVRPLAAVLLRLCTSRKPARP
jgi:hypothetical protein